MFTYLKWGCLGVPFIAIVLTFVYFNEANDSTPTLTIEQNRLGGMSRIQMVSHGQLNYLLKADTATEAYPQIGAFFTTSLVSYYELDHIEFECDLKGIGHAHYQAGKGKLDKRMDHMRIAGPVLIQFDSGYTATAERVDVNLKNGHVNPVALYINVDGHRAPVGSRKWEIH